ncbi:MAG: adenosylcobinamide-GDP ribazoletransferase [Eubacterium sp.]
MRKLLIAISFFTRFPIKLKDVSEEEFYDSMIFMPVVGLFIGILLYAVTWALSFIHVIQLQALLTMIIYIWISGGLHLDGFADTVDALFSARDHDKMMEIMKDSRLGSFGAIGLILLFLTIWSCYTALLPVYPLAIILMPVIGRYCAIQSCCFSTYAQGGGGLGRRIVEMTKPVHVIVYLILILPAAYFLLGPLAFYATLGTMLLGFGLMWYLKRKIGGMTGDTIGLTIELTQVIYLVILTIVLANWPGLLL